MFGFVIFVAFRVANVPYSTRLTGCPTPGILDADTQAKSIDSAEGATASHEQPLPPPPRSFGNRLAALGIILVATLLGIFVQPHQASAISLPCLQPPTNVDLTTLSDAQLQRYGLPGRGSKVGDALTAWKNLLLHAKHRVCTSTPTNISASRENTYNWAGNVATGGGYSDAYAGFTVPCVNYYPEANALSTHWVGFGGDTNDGGGNLVQTGVESDSGDYVRGTQFFAWYEDYPTQPTEQFLFPVYCGNDMFAEVYNSSSGDIITIEDFQIKIYSTLVNPSSNHSTAEWISERPLVDGYFYDPLANFNYAQFTGVQATQNGVAHVISNLSHNSVYMCNDGACGSGSIQLAHPGPINYDTFTNYFDNAGP